MTHFSVSIGISLWVLLGYLVEVVFSKQISGQFFASSDQEHTLYFLNDTLYVEYVNPLSHQHVQIRQDSTPLIEVLSQSNKTSATKTPLVGVLYQGSTSFVGKNLNLYLHHINEKQFELRYLTSIDLSPLFPLTNSTNSNDYINKNSTTHPSPPEELDFILAMHVFHEILSIRTHHSHVFLNATTLIQNISKATLSTQSHTEFSKESLIASVIPSQELAYIDLFTKAIVSLEKPNNNLINLNQLKPQKQLQQQQQGRILLPQSREHELPSQKIPSPESKMNSRSTQETKDEATPQMFTTLSIYALTSSGESSFLLFKEQSLEKQYHEMIIPVSACNEFIRLISTCIEAFDFDMTTAAANSSKSSHMAYDLVIQCNSQFHLLHLSSDGVLSITLQSQHLPKRFYHTHSVTYLSSSSSPSQHILAMSTHDELCLFSYSHIPSTNNKFLSPPPDTMTSPGPTLGKDSNSNESSSEANQITTSSIIPHSICMRNRLLEVGFTHFLFSRLDKKVTIVLSSISQKVHQKPSENKIYGQIVDQCRLTDLRDSIACDICIGCSNSCAFLALESCMNGLIYSRFSLGIVIFVIMILSILASIAKQMKKLVKDICRSIGKCIGCIVCRTPYFIAEAAKFVYKYTRIACRKCFIRYLNWKHRLWLFILTKRGARINEENDDICPICMEVLRSRPVSHFICKNHQAHIDCLEEYNNSKILNDLPLDCPFRDVQKSPEQQQSEPAPVQPLSSSSSHVVGIAANIELSDSI